MSLGVTVKKVFVLGALCMLFVSACSGKKNGASSLTIKEGELTVGAEIGYPPMEYFEADGKTIAGFDVDFAQAIDKEMGLKARFVDTAWDGIFAGLNTDKYDVIISAVTMTEERLKAFSFSKPYIGNAMTIVIRADSPIIVNAPEDISGYRVTYQGESTANIYADRLAQNGVRFEPYAYASVMNCFDELRNNRVDIVVVDSLVVHGYMKRDPGVFKIVYQGTADERFGICIKKGNDELTTRIDLAMDAVFESGELARISEKYFSADLVSEIWFTGDPK